MHGPYSETLSVYRHYLLSHNDSFDFSRRIIRYFNKVNTVWNIGKVEAYASFLNVVDGLNQHTSKVVKIHGANVKRLKMDFVSYNMV